VNKDANSLLRLGLPINSPEVRKLQAQIEGVGGDLRVKRIGAAKDGLQKARGTIASTKEAGKMLAAARPAEVEKAQALLAYIDGDLAAALEELGKQAGQGSVQERELLDKANAAQAGRGVALRAGGAHGAGGLHGARARGVQQLAAAPGPRGGGV